MGSQQILLIVIGVVIVGIAIVVGIGMFSSQAFNSNRDAIIAEMNTFKSSAKEYWMLPVTLGGASQDLYHANIARLATHLGFAGANESEYAYSSDNGQFRLVSFAEGDVEIIALGSSEKGGKRPRVRFQYNLVMDTSDMAVDKAASFTE